MITFTGSAADQLQQQYLDPEIIKQRQQTLNHIDAKKNQRILDFGCGPGLLSRDLADLVGPNGKVIGVDISERMIKLAKRHCKDLQQSQFICSSLDQIDNKILGQFDAITCIQTLLYINSPIEMIERFSSLLKPGGKLYIIETDWRGTLINHPDQHISQKIWHAWDNALDSAHLPAILPQLLSTSPLLFKDIHPITLIFRKKPTQHYAYNMINDAIKLAIKQKLVTEKDALEWMKTLDQIEHSNAFLFSITRFLFIAEKPPT